MAGVRNSAEIGQNLMLVIKRLLANDDFVNLLYYTDKNPLNHDALTQEQKQKEVFEKLLKIVPRVGPKETANSIVSVRVISGSINSLNGEFSDIEIGIEIFVPLTQWIIVGDNLRPFAILGQIQKSLDDKTISGLGKMKYRGFSLNFLTEETGCYESVFSLTQYV